MTRHPFLEWMAAWFGGCASTAFWNNDAIFGWTSIVIALGLLAVDIFWPEKRQHDHPG